jgi:hypothetical protein
MNAGASGSRSLPNDFVIARLDDVERFVDERLAARAVGDRVPGKRRPHPVAGLNRPVKWRRDERARRERRPDSVRRSPPPVSPTIVCTAHGPTRRKDGRAGTRSAGDAFRAADATGLTCRCTTRERLSARGSGAAQLEPAIGATGSARSMPAACLRRDVSSPSTSRGSRFLPWRSCSLEAPRREDMARNAGRAPETEAGLFSIAHTE